jgi:hypothetical protein
VASTTLHARRVGRTWTVTGAFSLDRPALLRLGLGTSIEAGSTVAGIRTGRPHPTLALRASGTVTVALRTPKRPLRLDVVATSDDGAATHVSIPIR